MSKLHLDIAAVGRCQHFSTVCLDAGYDDVGRQTGYRDSIERVEDTS